MYQNGHGRETAMPRLPPGAAAPRNRSFGTPSDEPTPVDVKMSTLSDPPRIGQYSWGHGEDSLRASIERGLNGLDADQNGEDHWVRMSRDNLYGDPSSSAASSPAGGRTGNSSIVSMYGSSSDAPLIEHPPVRTSSAATSPALKGPLSPSSSAHRITATSYSPTISPGSIRRSGARPLPPTPTTPRVTSSTTKPALATLMEGSPVNSSWTTPDLARANSTPPVSQFPFHGSHSNAGSAGRPSNDSSTELSIGSVNSGIWYSPASPAPDSFDPVTGRVTQTLSYDLASPSLAMYSPASEDERPLRTMPTSPTSTLSTRMPRPDSQTSLPGPRMSTVKVGARGIQRQEELVSPHLHPAFLSHLAIFVKDRVPRAEHTRGAVPYRNSFTGQDVVNTIQRALPDLFKADRRLGLAIARSLHGYLFFFDVRDNSGLLQDNLDSVYTFLEEEMAGVAVGEGSSSRKIASTPIEDLPTGIETELSPCYSPFCNRLKSTGQVSGCYSPSCPNNPASILRRQSSHTSERSQTPSLNTASDVPWMATVPAELLSLLGDTEIKRQNEIHELIAGESDYVRDIDILRTVGSRLFLSLVASIQQSGQEFLEPISEAEPSIVPSDEQSTFFAEVLLNAFEVREHAAAFLEALQHRKREQGPVIQSIGDVVVAAATDWESAYLRYAADYPFAEARIKREQATNLAFDGFLHSFTRRAATRKLAMQHYQTRITVRLQRYILLLGGIAKHTPEENPDRQSIEHAIDILTDQCKRADAGVEGSTLRLACRTYERDLIDRPGSSFVKELELSSEQRTIAHRGRMLRKPESSSFTDWTELFVILLDNYFIMTKPRAQGRTGETKYNVSRRPIPLELLTLFRYEEGPVPRSSGFHLPRSNTESNLLYSRDERLLWPMTFQYSGREGGIFTLFAESTRSRDEWREKLQDAIGKRQKILQSTRVMDVVPLCQDAFFMRQHAAESPVLRDGIRSLGRPTCSVAFQTPEGHQLVAIGHDDGLWIGLRHDPLSFRLVLHLKLITQCAVLQEFALVLVLADKALYAYPLEALVPSAASAAIQREKEPQKISGTKDVLFFKAGKVGSRLLVIYVKKSGVNQTVFKALEPIAFNDRSKSTLLKRRPDWFRTYKDFFCPSETFSIIFLRTQLSIVCAKGFELISLENEPLKMTSFPDWPLIARNDARASDIAKRCSESRALAMFRLDESEFLFVYEDLAIYSDKHGDPVPSRYGDVIDWHGRPRHVVFSRPYLIAFDSSFIEIRNAHTGKLVQIIKAWDAQCTFDGLGGVGFGTGESDRRAHVTMQLNGRHIVAELVPVKSPV